MSVVEQETPATTEIDFAGKVERSMRLLDKKIPGWEDKINLRTLRIEDSKHCILSQVYGDFAAGWERIGQRAICAAGGFSGPLMEEARQGHMPNAAWWGPLQDAWVAALTPRVTS